MKRKKRNLSVLITAGLIVCASNSFSIRIVTKEYTCPIGNEKFRAGISLPQQCPENKFVMFKENFTKEELKKYEKIINSKEYKAILQNSPKEYYLGRFYEMAGGFSDKEIGEAYYKSYIEHINRDVQNNDTLKESLIKGIDYFPSSLAYLYISNREYDKANALIEKQDKNIYLEKIADFYYSVSSLQKAESSYRYKYYNEIGIDEKAKKIFREKALNYLQEVIRKNNGQYSGQELLRQAELYSSLGNKKAIDEVFLKAQPKHWKLIILHYLDEHGGIIGEVYDKNNLSTEADLKKALSYADKLEKMTYKSFKENINMETKNIKRNYYLEAAFLKAEAERRLGKFEEALKTLSKVDAADIKNTAFNSDLEKLKELIEKKDNSVSQYIPGRIMY